MKTFTLMLFCSLLLHGAVAQKARAVAQEKMKPLEWLLGEWTGGGSIISKDGKQSFEQHETLALLLEGTVLNLKGIALHGKDTVHQAFSMIYWDFVSQSYKLIAFTGGGESALADVTIDPQHRLKWKMKTPDGQSIVYTIVENEKKEWVEKGTIEGKDGKVNQFFEMTLKRK